MQRSQIVETVHGEVEYKTVECDMCGNHVKESDAVSITADARMEDYWGGMFVEHGYRRNMCSFCAESFFDRKTSKGAIVTSPWQVLAERWRQTDDAVFAISAGIVLGFLGAMIFLMGMNLLSMLF